MTFIGAFIVSFIGITIITLLLMGFLKLINFLEESLPRPYDFIISLTIIVMVLSVLTAMLIIKGGN